MRRPPAGPLCQPLVRARSVLYGWSRVGRALAVAQATPGARRARAGMSTRRGRRPGSRRDRYRAPIVRTLTPLTIRLGAKLGANDHRHRATPDHVQLLSPQPSGTSGYTGRRPATLRDCLLSSRSRVRVAVGARIAKLNGSFRNYCRHDEVLLAGSYLYVIAASGDASAGRPARQNGGREHAAAGDPSPGAKGGAMRSRCSPVAGREHRPRSTCGGALPHGRGGRRRQTVTNNL
jgi:hypothetical protein